jgi:chromosome segregation protein
LLKLHKLELSGFKSFVDPVSLDVAGGMTAIVGPNGCGKSNIADAVVWALGERSAKSLRGETMEDVIFAGAKNRKPLGMAEVTLELASDNGFPAAEDGRISIGRRVFRGGENKYYLNGKTVRLKDIRDLLMDTGLGIRAYSMIEQGKIGMILSGKPQERRKLLEEAAGITRYRERRRIAEVKLEEARGNLARLDDIVSELERSLRSLKRQANAARRYTERQEAYKDLLRHVLDGRWWTIHCRLLDLGTKIGALVTTEAESTAKLHEQEATYAEFRERLETLSHRLADGHGVVAGLAATIEGKQEFLKGSRSRLQEISERLASGETAAKRRRERMEQLESSLGEYVERRVQLAGERESAASELNEDEARISQVEALVSRAEGELASLRDRLVGSISSLTSLRNAHHRQQVDREKGELRRRHIEAELDRKTLDLEAARQTRDKSRSLVEEQRDGANSLETQHKELSDTLAKTSRRRNQAQEQARLAEDEIHSLRQRRQLLYELGEKQEERRSLLQQALEDAGLAQRPFLIDQIEVPEGWEGSLDLFLGELEDAVILESDDNAIGLAESLSEGPATGRLLRPHGTAHFLHLRIDDPSVQASLGEALGLPAEMAAVLPPAYLVDSPADAQRLAHSNPGVAFISRDRLWAQAGAIHFQGAQAKPGHLAREQELGDIDSRLPDLEQVLASQKTELESLDGQVEEHTELIALKARDLAEIRERLAVAQARLDDGEKQHHRLSSERQTLEDEISEVDRELGQMIDREGELAGQVAEADIAHAQLESDFDAAQSIVEQRRQDREVSRTSGASRRGRFEVLAERLDSHDQEMNRLRDEIEEHTQNLAQWQSEVEHLESRQEAIQDSMEQADSDLQLALEKKETSQIEVLEQQQLLDGQREEMQSLEAAIETCRDERDGLRGEIGELRVSEAAVKQEAEHLSETYQEEFQQQSPPDPVEPSGDLAEMEAELERRKLLLDRMGPVNELAASEFDEQNERHEFLTVQRADVADSVDRLKQTIREINETSSQRFKETFEEVNEHFRKIYVDLFRGGEAEMRLLDDEDVLETVIEIVARPPGKRLQNLMLLSGGEKALTAIALLFALFKAKPSPFCILDEVDAPLDDVNTLRFVELLRKMSRDTQFVVITHNKLTMEAANILYGVTMQERGVSNLVSVELDSVQPQEEPEAALAV